MDGVTASSPTALYRLVRGLDPSFLAWDRAGPVVAGAAIALAGVYQLTPLKRACLRHCRTPLSFVMHRWHDGPRGAVRMGIEHGAWCVGCCWALMVVLFAVGVMSITWMVVVAAIVFAEKVLPVGERVATALAVVLVAFGVWVAVAPGSVPGLTRPGSGMKMDEMLPSPTSVVRDRRRYSRCADTLADPGLVLRVVQLRGDLPVPDGLGGVKGGRSTYGICFGVLSWLVEDGHAGEVDLSGLAAAFVIRYDDDEPGSPWSFVVHVDERGTTSSGRRSPRS